MVIHKMALGQLQTNCYIIQTENNNAIIIDSGANPNQVMDFIKTIKLKVSALMLTHGHYDHTGAVDEIKKQTGANIYIHKDDAEMLENAQKGLAIHFMDESEYVPIKADVLMQDGTKFEFDEVSIEVIHTPGHSKGSCVFVAGEYMFSGDTLFERSIGRTDLYGGDMGQMKASLKKLALIDADLLVLPGHGDSTTLRKEKRANPHMGTNYDDIF